MKARLVMAAALVAGVIVAERLATARHHRHAQVRRIALEGIDGLAGRQRPR
ncbi:hypothetical protein [Cutibacterium granulosum]|uniref:hypothetical protein n=1 Tax=Cutibacterium granulosum TaxID=33011 RepID=UPI0025739588|nr:hypothetical protein [Cutibacterium granulosum]MDU1524264.1 hypothetical protein [Cutibacterium granulosum]MDU4677454.1 hypothetical protein [Cutibacterium granulosum]MDU7728678.1 hypothetical protein [Cutibacterium granulosum]